MALKLLLFGCVVAANLVAAERYGVSRGRQDGFGGHGGHGGHGGGFGGHGHGPMHGGGHDHGPMHGGGHGHGPMHGGGHGHGPMHGGGHGHGGHGEFQPCGGGGCHRPPPHDPHRGHDHFHNHDHGRPQEPHPHEPKQPEDPHPQEPKQPEERHPQEPKKPQIPEIEVNFIVHEPEGLEAWIVQQSEVVFFGIEVYVNTEPSNAGTKCDVCTNTTVITNGKLLIEDVDVVVKRGDVLYYYALIGNGHSVVRQKLQVLHVTESLIGKCNCPGTSDIQDIDIRFSENGPRAARDVEFLQFDPNEEFYTKAPAADTDEVYEPRVLSKEEEKLADELDELKRDHFFLGRIIDFMSQRKACAVRMTNYLLLQKLPFPATRTSELEAFLRSYFAEDVDLQKLGRAIRHVSLASEGRGIEFEMETYVDKQMVLYWTRHKRLNAPVVDPDFIDKKNTV